jgi:Pyrimidine dimer DNA glycosylase (EC 3.2.2.17)/DNA-(apurinic or apyrimidinic site) lyase (EC 4.2.99.18)
MRLWSIHPKYLDVQGLLGLWREGLLAQKVLLGETKGYRNHPQLIRFKRTSDPCPLPGDLLILRLPGRGQEGVLLQRGEDR